MPRFHTARTVGFATMLVAMAACGSSSTAPTRGITITDYATDFTRVTTDFDNSRILPDTPVADVPVSGVGRYDGRVLLETNGEPAAVGAVSIDISFAAPGTPATIAGTMDGFVNSNDVAVPGELQISGDMTPGTSSFTAWSTGSLTVEGGDVFRYTTSLNGGLKNADGAIAGGVIRGETTNDGGATFRAVRGQIVLDATDSP